MKTTIKKAYEASKKDETLGWVTFKDIEEPQPQQVWCIDCYDHSERAYLLYNWNDTNKWKYCKGDKECFIGFTF